MGRFKFIKNLIVITSMVFPLFVFGQGYPRFELYQLVQGQDSGQFVTTGIDSNLDFNSVMRFRFQDSTLLIGADTVITDADIAQYILSSFEAGLGIELNVENGVLIIESLSIEDSIKNQTGSFIEKGTPLYAVGEQGNYWSVAPARADDPSKMPVVVIAGEDLDDGETGLGLIKGHIKQVNTTGLADGSQVYVGATGGYTSTKPTDEGVIIQRLGTVIKGETTNGSGIINLGDEGLWNDYTSLTKLRDTLVLVRGSITTEIGDSLTNYASRTELADTALAIRSDFPTGSGDVTTAQLADTASAIRGDIPSEISDSLLNYVTINTTQTITGEKTFNTDVEINGKLDLLTDGLSVFIGTDAGRIEDGVNRRNIGIGNNALYTSDEGNNNIAIGYNSNYQLIDAANNIGIGNASLYSNESGSRNIGIGRSSLYVNEAESNVAVGYESFYWNETGSNNVAYGMRAGNNTNSGGQNKNTNNSVFIGYNTKALSTADINEIVIGYEANGLGSNTAVIGNSSITKLNANKYTFNVDQDTTGKDGQVLTFNSSSGEVELTQTGDVTTSQLADTASAIRADFPSGTGDVTTAQLADTASAIRADIPSLPITLGTNTNGNYVATAGVSGNGLSGSASGEGSTFTVSSNATTNNTGNTIVYRDGSGNFNAGTITASLSGNSSTATKLQTSRTISLTSDVTGGASFDGSANASITATVVDDSHNHVISNVDNLSDSLSALRTAINAAGGGGITATNTGNNRIPTFSSSTNIDGGNNFWINDFGEMVDDLSDGTSPTSVGYKIKIDNDVFFQHNYSTNTTVNTTFTSKGNSIFEGSVGNTTINNGGQLGIQVTPSVNNHSLTTYYGAIFNTNKDVLDRGDFRINSSIDNMFVVDSDIDAIGIGGATPNAVWDVNIYGGVQINSSAAGGIYDGLLVQGDTDPALLNVNADRDKVGISTAFPDYTLDVTGDINFTGDLYDDGVLFSGGGVTINNNTDNYLLTASGTANTINGESGLTWDGDSLQLNGDMRVNSEATFTLYNTYFISGLAGQIELENENGKVYLDYNGNFVVNSLAGVNDVGADAVGTLQAASSDTTLKTNIIRNEYGLNQIMNLETIKFNWKDTQKQGNQNEVGFNAQNLQEFIPEATYTIPSTGKLGIKDDAIIATLTKAIQEQQIIIESQDKRIKQLEELVKKLIEKK